METETLRPAGVARKDKTPDWLLRGWAAMVLKGRPVPQCRLEQLRAWRIRIRHDEAPPRAVGGAPGAF